MDPIILLVIVVFILFVLVALAGRMQSGSSSPERPETLDATFVFEEDTEQLSPTTGRRTSILAPAQDTPGGKRKLDITPMALPDLTDAVPPPEKEIDAILVTILNPSARYADADVEVNDFSPALTLIVDYKPEDAASTTMENGVPRLSLATVYRSKDGWRFERLSTEVKPNGGGGGTLTAALKTLQPNDPVVFCRP